MRTLLKFRWPRGLDKLEYLENYGRKSSKRLSRRKAVRGYFHVLYFRSFYRDLRVRHFSCKSPLII